LLDFNALGIFSQTMAKNRGETLMAGMNYVCLGGLVKLLYDNAL